VIQEPAQNQELRNPAQAAGPSVVIADPVPEMQQSLPAGENTAVIESPMVGTFYAAPAEGEAPFVQVGDTVTKGQTVGIVEAMKLMNEIEAECSGVVEAVLVENEQLIEYGQPLFRIRQ
jgi:acetyl-CoA carboxylase biotin carboxyl carrier protein